MKKLGMAFAATILVVSVVAVHVWRDLRAEREQLTSLQTQLSTLEAARNAALAAAESAAPMEVVNLAGPATLVSPPEKPAEPASAPTSAASKPPAARTPAAAASGMVEAMLSKDGLRMMMSQMYPNLAADMGLTPEEANKLLDLLARQQAGSVGDSLAMMTGGSSAAAQEAQIRVADQELANQKELSALLGSKYPQWEQYQGTVAARTQVNQLRGLLGSGENALTEAQATPLIEALGFEAARVNKEMQSKMQADAHSSKNLLQAQLSYSAEQNHRMIDVASSHLTAPQLVRYKQMLGQQEEMMRTMMGAMGGAGAPQGQPGAPR